jgi:hypothetical protein
MTCHINSTPGLVAIQDFLTTINAMSDLPHSTPGLVAIQDFLTTINAMSPSLGPSSV